MTNSARRLETRILVRNSSGSGGYGVTYRWGTSLTNASLVADGGLDEDAQYAVYRRMLEEMAPAPVTVRTFDVDEEQLAMRTGRRSAGGWGGQGERERREGLRGLRLSLERPELFQTQLRALLRAARCPSRRAAARPW